MYRKHKNYSLLAIQEMATDYYDKPLKIFILVVAFFVYSIGVSVVEKRMGFEIGYISIFLIVCWIFVRSIVTSDSKLLSTLPVSKEFEVINKMIMVPLFLVKYIVLGLLGSAMIGVLVTLKIDGPVIPMPRITIMDIEVIVIYILLIEGTWAIFSISAFLRDKKNMLMTLTVTAVVLANVVYGIVHYVTKGMAYRGTYNIMDLLMAGNDRVILLCVLFYAVAATLIAYRVNLAVIRMQRTNFNVKETKDETQFSQQLLLQETMGKKKKCVIAVILTILIIAFLENCVFELLNNDGGKQYKYYTNDASKYEEWNSILELNGLPDYVVSESDWQTVTFPEKVNENDVVKYIADFHGECGPDGEDEDEYASWNNLVFTRYLSLKLNDKDYEAEKTRIKDFTYREIDVETEKETGRKNHLLKDTENFPNETYIATWDTEVDEYEYVMLDDEKRQVTYVFVSNDDIDAIKTDNSIKPKNMKMVVTIFNANTDHKGFSVKSFYDEKRKEYNYY